MIKTLYSSLPRVTWRKTKNYADSEEGIATLEFALIFPVLLALFYGVAEIINYSMIKRRANMAVDFGIEFMSRDDDNTMTHIERMNALDIYAIVNPKANGAQESRDNVRGDAGFTRSFAAVEFIPMPAGCSGATCTSYEPNVIWTFYWGASGRAQNPIRIQCDLEVVPDTFKLNGQRMPEGMTGRGAVVMGHYTFTYVPLLKTKFLPQQDIHVSAIRKTRGENALEHPYPGFQC